MSETHLRKNPGWVSLYRSSISHLLSHGQLIVQNYMTENADESGTNRLFPTKLTRLGALFLGLGI